jgi:hypothetical protein
MTALRCMKKLLFSRQEIICNILSIKDGKDIIPNEATKNCQLARFCGDSLSET